MLASQRIAAAPNSKPVDSGAAGFEGTWIAPDEANMTDQARYGKLLLTETYKYLGLGSQSSLKLTGNKLACSNCHMEEGRAAYAGPWSVVYLKYEDPGIFSSRTNERRNLPIRVNGCIQRSMWSINAQQLDPQGEEMLAITAYFQFLSTGMTDLAIDPATGKVSHKGVIGQGFIEDIPDLQRAANQTQGKIIYAKQCLPCHGENGEGMWDEEAERFIYPALWGSDSFAIGAGMDRIRTGVGFVRGNMPYGRANPLDHQSMLSIEEAWDVMAYVISNPRPHYQNLATDWSGVWTDGVSNWARKNVDAGYPPYYPRKKPDGTPDYSGDLSLPPYFTPEKHMYGPFQDMLKLQKLILCTNWPTLSQCQTSATVTAASVGQDPDFKRID